MRDSCIFLSPLTQDTAASLGVVCGEDRTAAREGPASGFSARVRAVVGFAEVYFDVKAVVTAILTHRSLVGKGNAP